MARKSKPERKDLAKTTAQKRARNSQGPADSSWVIEKSRKKRKLAKTKAAPRPEASLLDIPVELRLLILEQLMPGVDEPIAHRTCQNHCDSKDCDCEDCADENCFCDECCGGFNDMDRADDAEPLFHYDEKSYQPSILLVNHQIYNEGIALLHDRRKVHCMEIDDQEVRGYGQRVWSVWYPSSPSSSSLSVFDRRLRLIDRLHVNIKAGFDDRSMDLGVNGQPDGTVVYNFRSRIHALVDAIIRTGTIKEIAIRSHGQQLPDHVQDREQLEDYREDVLCPFGRLRGLHKACIIFGKCD